MKLSWNHFKISIAGARLSHLAQEDSIWDHGSMIEQVRTIFYHLEKAKNKKEIEPAKKYLTPKALEEVDFLMKENEESKFLKSKMLKEISIINVKVKTRKHPDCFSALLKGNYLYINNDELSINENQQHIPLPFFSERWTFIRQGNWWLLDRIK